MLPQLTNTADLSNEEKLNRYDYILFIIVFICPYTDSGVWWMLTSFIPPLNSLGSSFLAFTLSLYLFQYAIRCHYRTSYRMLYWFVWCAVAWSVFKFSQTIVQVGFTEALTIYRRNYILLPSFMLCMIYISGMSLVKLELFAKLILKWSIILSVIYFIQCAGLNIFNITMQMQASGGVAVMRNIIGMPPIMPCIFAFSYIMFLYKNNKESKLLSLTCIAVVFFSFTRNLTATACIIIAFSTLLYTWKFGLQDNYKLLIYPIIGLGVLAIVLPNSIEFWSNLIDDTINNQLAHEKGTYAFREKLIDKAITTAKTHSVLWSGLGYIRDTAKGQYGLVLGTDTYVAPILWCEGVIGMILRCLPSFYLLVRSWNIFKRHYYDIRGQLSLVIMVCVVSQIPNYVQTSIFMKFNFTITMLYMMLVYIEKINERETKY